MPNYKSFFPRRNEVKLGMKNKGKTNYRKKYIYHFYIGTKNSFQLRDLFYWKILKTVFWKS